MALKHSDKSKTQHAILLSIEVKEECKLEMEIWQNEVKDFTRRKATLHNTLATLHEVVCG